MRDDLRRAAERLWTGAARKAVGPSGPVIVTRGRDRPLHSYRDAAAFEQALRQKRGDQRVAVIIQVAFTEPRYSDVLGGHYRREDEWKDVEVWEPPTEWGGVLSKNADAGGRPRLQTPTQADLLAVAARYGARAARYVFRTDVGGASRDSETGKMGNSDPVTSPVVRAIHGGD